MGRRSRLRAALGGLIAVALMAAGCSGDDAGEDGGDEAADETPTTVPAPVVGPRDEPLPGVVPTPQALAWVGPDVAVAETVQVVVAAAVDEPTRTLVTDVLRTAGAADVTVAEAGASAGEDPQAGAAGDTGLVVRLGAPDDAGVAAVLADAGVAAPAPVPAEGYALAAVSYGDEAPGAVAVAAAEPAGWFYGAQTLRQLVRPGAGDGDAGGAVAGVSVVDRPAMGTRGTIEGFYGSPWTPEERRALLTFQGRLKLNTYVYAPKDDPFHRDRWREPYPADRLAELADLVALAADNHVRFTFAVSPGPSICYSDPADTAALSTKLGALYDVGVRSFTIALDDIVADRWNCEGDASAFGPASMEAAARAQVRLLNELQAGFVATHEGARPLQMVPTEYRNTDDSPYRAVLRTGLDPAVEVMWTGSYVVPAEVTVAQAEAAATVFGRRTLLWDNTPTNDWPATEGRLLLGPYDRRQPGLSGQLNGILSNPMNQAAASQVALVGVADFAWNDAAYDPARAHHAAAEHLAEPTEASGRGPAPTAGGAGDAPDRAAVVDALLAFFDTAHLAPTSAADGRLSLPQAPALAAELDAFRSAWEAGDHAGAVEGLRPYAERLAGATALIEAGAQPAFVADAQPWLDALALWGEALVATLDGLAARAGGDTATADARFAASADLVTQARAVHTIAGETRPQGPVRVADGVLDAFLAEALSLS